MGDFSGITLNNHSTLSLHRQIPEDGPILLSRLHTQIPSGLLSAGPDIAHDCSMPICSLYTDEGCPDIEAAAAQIKRAQTNILFIPMDLSTQI